MRMPSISVLIIFIDLTFGLKIRNSKTYPQWSLPPFCSPVCGGQKPQEREDVTALRWSEPLRYKVGGPSKVYAMLCGMGPSYYSSLIRTTLL